MAGRGRGLAATMPAWMKAEAAAGGGSRLGAPQQDTRTHVGTAPEVTNL